MNGPAFRTIGLLALSMMRKSNFLVDGLVVYQSDIKQDSRTPTL